MLNNPMASPIRVVVFTSGPTIRPGIQRFIVRLEEHPEIELLAVYCQTPGTSIGEVTADLWRRRKWLALPLMTMQLAGLAGRYLFHPVRTVSLKMKMDSLRDRIHLVRDIHAPTVLASVREQTSDLGLIYGGPILKPELFDIPACGTLGIHHGTLPKYRGKKTTFWAMYNGESEAGVTIQKINAGLDTGQIVQEGTVSTRGRSLRAVWHALEELGYELYLKAIIEIKKGSATYRLPEGRKGKLLRDPKPGHIFRFYWRRLTKKG